MDRVHTPHIQVDNYPAITKAYNFIKIILTKKKKILTKLIYKYLTHCLINIDRKSTRLNSSHSQISYAVFCLKKTYETGNRAAPQLQGELSLDRRRRADYHSTNTAVKGTISRTRRRTSGSRSNTCRPGRRTRRIHRHWRSGPP